MKTKLEVILIICLTLLIGSIAGVLGHRAYVRYKISCIRRPMFSGAGRHGFPRRRQELFVRRFMRIIKPNPMQREKIKEILDKHQNEFNQIQNDFRNKFYNLTETIRKELNPILTPEQKKKLAMHRRKNKIGKLQGFGQRSPFGIHDKHRNAAIQ